MKRRFVIISNQNTIDRHKRDTITGLLQGKGWHVWHWFEDLWLVVANDATDLTTDGLMKEIKKTKNLAEIEFIVFEASDDGELVGMTPIPAHPWLKTHWYEY